MCIAIDASRFMISIIAHLSPELYDLEHILTDILQGKSAEFYDGACRSPAGFLINLRIAWCVFRNLDLKTAF